MICYFPQNVLITKHLKCLNYFFIKIKQKIAEKLFMFTFLPIFLFFLLGEDTAIHQKMELTDKKPGAFFSYPVTTFVLFKQSQGALKTKNIFVCVLMLYKKVYKTCLNITEIKITVIEQTTHNRTSLH